MTQREFVSVGEEVGMTSVRRRPGAPAEATVHRTTLAPTLACDHLVPGVVLVVQPSRATPVSVGTEVGMGTTTYR